MCQIISKENKIELVNPNHKSVQVFIKNLKPDVMLHCTKLTKTTHYMPGGRAIKAKEDSHNNDVTLLTKCWNDAKHRGKSIGIKY